MMQSAVDGNMFVLLTSWGRQGKAMRADFDACKLPISTHNCVAQVTEQILVHSVLCHDHTQVAARCKPTGDLTLSI